MFSKKKNAEFFEVLDKPFHCQVCDHDKFFHGRSQLNTAMASFLNLDWANKSVAHLTCERCGHMAWFNQKK